MIGNGAINNNLTLNWLDNLEVGDIFQYPSNTPPRRSLPCHGQAVSRTTYADLFGKIGTSYGTGDGSTTFNVPDMRGRVAQGIYQSSQTVGQKFEAGLPNITGTISSSDDYGPMRSATASGCFYVTQKRSGLTGESKSKGHDVTFQASRSSAIYGKSTTIQPLALGVNFYIKY